MEAYIDLLKSIMNRYREDFRFFKVNAYQNTKRKSYLSKKFADVRKMTFNG